MIKTILAVLLCVALSMGCLDGSNTTELTDNQNTNEVNSEHIEQSDEGVGLTFKVSDEDFYTWVYESIEKIMDMFENNENYSGGVLLDYDGEPIDLTAENDDNVDYESIRPYITLMNDQITSDIKEISTFELSPEANVIRGEYIKALDLFLEYTEEVESGIDNRDFELIWMSMNILIEGGTQVELVLELIENTK